MAHRRSTRLDRIRRGLAAYAGKPVIDREPDEPGERPGITEDRRLRVLPGRLRKSSMLVIE